MDYDVLAFPRSSVSKYNLVLANSIGLIDADYRGEVLLRFKYIWQPEDYRSVNYMLEGKPNIDKIYNKGDKICQLKVTHVENVKFELVNELDSTNRGDGGFGSTDTKKGPKAEDASKQMVTMEAIYNKLGGTNQVPKKYVEIMKERNLQ